jgi:hypothetical protein
MTRVTANVYHVRSTMPAAYVAGGRKHDCIGVQSETAGQAPRLLHKIYAVS